MLVEDEEVADDGVVDDDGFDADEELDAVADDEDEDAVFPFAICSPAGRVKGRAVEDGIQPLAV